METVEVVIKISKNRYETLVELNDRIKKRESIYKLDGYEKAIANGVLLPEGHGRLVDTHDLDLCIMARMININATDSIPLKDLYDCIKNETKTILEVNKDGE